jgi:predicted TPR repeat methyltransferase
LDNEAPSKMDEVKNMAAIDLRISELMHRLRKYTSEGRLGAARPMLRALQQLAAPAAQLHEIEAQVLSLEGRNAEAQAVLDSAIVDDPDDVSLRLCRVEARLQRHAYLAAANDAATAVLLQPDLPSAKVALGRVFLHQARYADAIACLQEAVTSNPVDSLARLSLAQALDLAGDGGAVTRVLVEGIALLPRDLRLRIAAILHQIRRLDFVQAEALAETARRDGVADACVFGLLGHARSSLGLHDAAAEAYAEARRLAPGDPYVGHLTAAAGLTHDAGRASPDYVRVLFDGYAPSFDNHLISLGYRIPGLLRREVELFNREGGGRISVLDLGCGTGLVGVALSGLTLQCLVGVDLSTAMLAEAARRDLYQDLHQADLESFLTTETRQFSLVLAADVLPYLGNLSEVFRLVGQRLLSCGRMMFSVERFDPSSGDEREWLLGWSGRYAHAPAYLRTAAAAAGLDVVFMRDETIRLEGLVPVRGLLVGLEKSAE